MEEVLTSPFCGPMTMLQFARHIPHCPPCATWALGEAAKRMVEKGDQVMKPLSLIPLGAAGGPFQLRRDGALVFTGTEQECWAWIHRQHSYSVAHALQFEGYTLEEA